jgi:hypothetical protein
MTEVNKSYLDPTEIPMYENFHCNIFQNLLHVLNLNIKSDLISKYSCHTF